MTEQEDYIWAAGFLDGEGCISLYGQRKGRNYRLQIDVTNTHLPALDKLKSMFGGSICVKKRVKPEHRPTWVWQIFSVGAAAALEKMLPYLFVKREEAVVGLLSRHYMGRRGVKDSMDLPRLRQLSQELKDLKRPTFTEEIITRGKRILQ